ncbi:MAG: mCpol domain-containing protein [Candidatus Helarchaeota archaeon]
MMYFLALDGDDIGKKIEKYLIENDIFELKNFSREVNNFFCDLAIKFRNLGAKIIYCSGDDLLCQINDNNLKKFIEIIKNGERFTISGGIGKSSLETYIALKYAKVKGKNQIIKYWEINL